jgi:hypothetical protein
MLKDQMLNMQWNSPSWDQMTQITPHKMHQNQNFEKLPNQI